MNEKIVSYFIIPIPNYWLTRIIGLIWFGIIGLITLGVIAMVYNTDPFPISLYLACSSMGSILGFLFTPMFIHSLKTKRSILYKNWLYPALNGLIVAVLAIFFIDFFYAAVHYNYPPDNVYPDSGSFFPRVGGYFLFSVIFFWFIVFPIGMLSGITYSYLIRKVVTLNKKLRSVANGKR